LKRSVCDRQTSGSNVLRLSRLFFCLVLLPIGDTSHYKMYPKGTSINNLLK
jgi:hypothetical protein